MSLAFRYQSIRNGLVGHWRPSRGATGNVLLDSVNKNHGVLTFDPLWQASDDGLALRFDGTNKYVAINGLISRLSTQVTASTWFYNTGNYTGYATLYDAGQVFNANTRQLSCFLGGSNAQLYVAIRGSAGAFLNLNNTLELERWTNLVLTFDGATITAFIDGIARGTATTGFGTSFTEYEMRFGANPTGGGTFFSGFQDDFAVFSRALNPSEVLTLYTAGRGALDRRVNVPVVRGYVASGGAYTLTADAASFTLAGQSATLVANRTITANQASFTLTGQTANTTPSRLIIADQASFAATAQDATLKASRLVTADQATYTLSGQDAALVSGNTLTADSATFSLGGQAAALAVSRLLTADRGLLTATGQDATLAYSGASSSAPYLTIDFTGNNVATGSIAVTSATGSIQATETTGSLVVTETGN